jgi:Uncharacterized protein conserved in bacteria
MMDQHEIRKRLAEPFSSEDIEWRVQQTSKKYPNKGWAIAYLTNRAIQKRLDDVLGVDGWYNEFKPWRDRAQLCGIAIRFPDGNWIMKWDGSDDSDIEPVKGGLSDSMKRTAVQWGIGRYLYFMKRMWVEVDEYKQITESEHTKLAKAHDEHAENFRKKEAGKVTPMPVGPVDKAPVKKHAAAVNEPLRFAVVSTKIGTSGKGQKTMALALKDLSKNHKDATFFVYLTGVDEQLVPGAVLENTVIEPKQINGTEYYWLTSYEVAQMPEQAA